MATPLADDERDPYKRKSVRQDAEDEKTRQHRPKREAIEEGRDRGCPAEPIGEQEPDMPEGDKQAGEAEKGEMPGRRRPPAFETERHRRRHGHHHDIRRESHDHYRNARRHGTPDQIARRDQQCGRESKQSRR